MTPATESTAVPPPSDRAVVMRLMFGAWLQQALYVVAKLGVADALTAGTATADELAARVGAHPGALARFLRALCSVGLFAEPERGRFALNGPAELLRSDVPDSHRYIAILHGEEAYAACAEALHTARTGQPAFDRVYGKPYFDYLAEKPEARATFDAAMGQQTLVPLVAETCDFSGAQRIVDIGGGIGVFLSSVLERTPGASGVLFDLPPAVERAERNIARLGLTDRVSVVGGSCFDAVPAGGDVYSIVRVLHDFDDGQVLTVLRNVRAAVRPDGRLFVFDALLPESSGVNPGRLADLGMLMVLGGRYRTGADLAELVARAGFEVVGIRHAPPGSDPRAESVLEARPV
ncbi:methyltransferase [Micromonospora sp. NPDC049101]|uniref:methyltransferase n=1 Tax=unclassified Micromonospora TaxID=2617518 RepID=UPI0033FE6963